jgi:nicotinate-nucleotide adenylyltransferase
MTDTGFQGKTIALFGGSFNPPHVAHQLVALYVLETHAVDALWFLPTYTHPFGKDLAPYVDRAKMCVLATEPLGSRVQVPRTEEQLARRPGFVANRTLDLIEHLEFVHAGARFRLVIGSDILGETAQWYRWDEIVRRAPPIVVARPGYPDGDGPVMPDIAATRIRALLTAGDPAVEALVPRSVLRYIAAHGLYR